MKAGTSATPRPIAIVLPVPVPRRRAGEGASLTTNAYLLPDRPVTLVDPCGASNDAGPALAAGVSAAGLNMSDIRRVVLLDSCVGRLGPAVQISSISRAEFVVHPDAGEALVDPLGAWQRRQELLSHSARAAGVPASILSAYLDLSTAYTPDAAGLPRDALRSVADSETIRAGSATWRVLHTPGPSPSHLCLHHELSEALFSGSLLLRSRPTVPGLAPRGEDWGLAPLVASLRRLGRLRVDIAWPMEGEAIRAHRVLIARRLADARRRIQAAGAAVDAGAQTVWEVADALGEPTRPSDLPDTLAETTALLGWLTTRGRLERNRRGPLVCYSATGSRS